MKHAGEIDWNESLLVVISGKRIIGYLYFPFSFLCLFCFVFIFQTFHSAHGFPTNNYFKSFSGLVNHACTAS